MSLLFAALVAASVGHVAAFLCYICHATPLAMRFSVCLRWKKNDPSLSLLDATDYKQAYQDVEAFQCPSKLLCSAATVSSGYVANVSSVQANLLMYFISCDGVGMQRT